MTVLKILGVLNENFSQAEKSEYIGEGISQTAHALQCAYFAMQCGHSEEVVLACLLHDIGHFACLRPQVEMNNLGKLHHEWLGAQLAYALGLPAKIALLIGYHVDAKRYLLTKNESYLKRLSAASMQTLSFQGGTMSATELRQFSSHPLFKECLQVRVNDEKAKEPDLIVPALASYYPLIERHLNYSVSSKLEPIGDFVDKDWAIAVKDRLNRILDAEVN